MAAANDLGHMQGQGAHAFRIHGNPKRGNDPPKVTSHRGLWRQQHERGFLRTSGLCGAGTSVDGGTRKLCPRWCLRRLRPAHISGLNFTADRLRCAAGCLRLDASEHAPLSCDGAWRQAQ